MSVRYSRPHPLPASPIKGEVWAGDRDWIEPNEWRGTSPLMGEAGKGWSPAHGEIE